MQIAHAFSDHGLLNMTGSLCVMGKSSAAKYRFCKHLSELRLHRVILSKFADLELPQHSRDLLRSLSGYLSMRAVNLECSVLPWVADIVLMSRAISDTSG
jgi:hypothetical protein